MTNESLCRDWNGKPWHSLDFYLKKTFGKKVYKLALDGGMTCPNRDGTLGTGGCIFCSAGGSGDFAAPRTGSLAAQLADAKSRISRKLPKGSTSADVSYIAYFQSYTNTYAPLSYLKALFSEAIAFPEICALSVATRPDCLPPETISLLASLNRIKPVWVELGLQTIHEKTAELIRRGYPLSVFDDALSRLRKAGLPVIVHVILGLPKETDEDCLATVRYLAARRIEGIKLQLLHVLCGTDLVPLYEAGLFQTMEMEACLSLLGKCLAVLPPETVIHRLTGDGPKKELIAPLWTADKRRFLNALLHYLKENQIWQSLSYESVIGSPLR